MSAIFGIWHYDGKLINDTDINAMRNILTHYGRDEQDIYIEQHIAVGSCLNNISRYSQKEIPVYQDSHKNIILVADAQIYNREELILDYQLTENHFLSNQELLMEAYKKWGTDCPKYLNGDFAFALWDKENKQLTLFRDHLGVRPLYYYLNDSSFVFATDYRAILALPFVRKEINEEKLYKLLAQQIKYDAESTFFAGIKKLPQAHILTADKKGIEKKKYWSPGAGKKILFQTEEEYFQALYDVVLKAIKRRVRYTHLNIGAELSGGLDSSVIDILANRELMEQNKQLSLFSWSPSFQNFEKQERDERIFIEQVCNQEGLDCSYYDIVQDLKHQDLDKEAAVEAGAINPFQQELKKMSSEGIRLVLSGWGGDQGISHRTNLFELWVNGYFRHFLKEAFFLSKGSPLRLAKIIISNTISPLFKPYGYLGFLRKQKSTIMTKEFQSSMRKLSRNNILYFTIDLVKHIESGNIQTRTELVAWVGAEYNVQYLFPFLDPDVVDFAISIPRHMYYKKGINRYVYRKAFEGILPKELCYYVPKDDVARLTYAFDKLKEDDAEKVIVEQKLNIELFSPYIDFENAKKRLEELKEGSIQDKTQFKRQMNMCYNIQKILERAENMKLGVASDCEGFTSQTKS